MPHFIVIRYAEIGLKGKNRNWFENLLIHNIRQHLTPVCQNQIERIHGRINVTAEGDKDKITVALRYIPGIANFSFASLASHQLEDISEKAGKLLRCHEKENNLEGVTFKISASRSFKGFPLKSMQLSALIGADMLQQFPDLKVNLSNPQLDLGIEIWSKNRSIVYLEKIPGQNGLPVGSSGSVISFISGGIDSPVASWFMMKRGCKTVFLHFHSYPFVGEQSRQKVIDLVSHLSRYQPETTLLIVPFSEIQKATKAKCTEKNRTIIYRRMMYRIAEKLKDQHQALAYVTGEAVGQVASQTLENLACTEAVATVLVLRPLIGMEKAKIISLAKTIGTFPISIQPYPDCCTVFQPQKPEIHGKISNMEKDEKHLDLEELLTLTLEKIETLQFQTQVHDKFWAAT